MELPAQAEEAEEGEDSEPLEAGWSDAVPTSGETGERRGAPAELQQVHSADEEPMGEESDTDDELELEAGASFESPPEEEEEDDDEEMLGEDVSGVHEQVLGEDEAGNSS